MILYVGREGHGLRRGGISYVWLDVAQYISYLSAREFVPHCI